MLLLGDFSLVLLTLLQLYSISLVDVFLVLFILPFGILLPFPVGINALFSHGPRRSAGLARLYALWNLTSFINVVSFLSNLMWLVIGIFFPLSDKWIFPLTRVKYNDMGFTFLIWDCVTFLLPGGCISMWIYSLQLSILFQQKATQHSALEYHVRVFLASIRYAYLEISS